MVGISVGYAARYIKSPAFRRLLASSWRPTVASILEGPGQTTYPWEPGQACTAERSDNFFWKESDSELEPGLTQQRMEAGQKQSRGFCSDHVNHGGWRDLAGQKGIKPPSNSRKLLTWLGTKSKAATGRGF